MPRAGVVEERGAVAGPVAARVPVPDAVQNATRHLGRHTARLLLLDSAAARVQVPPSLSSRLPTSLDVSDYISLSG